MQDRPQYSECRKPDSGNNIPYAIYLTWKENKTLALIPYWVLYYGPLNVWFRFTFGQYFLFEEQFVSLIRVTLHLCLFYYIVCLNSFSNCRYFTNLARLEMFCSVWSFGRQNELKALK